jgi:L-arabinonolactonase
MIALYAVGTYGGLSMNFTEAVTCLLPADNYLGETPLWSVEEQALYWINVEQPSQLHRWQFVSNLHDVWPLPARVGGIVLQGGRGPLLILADGLYDFNAGDGSVTLRCPSPLPSHVTLHESQCDRQGRLWVGGYDHHFSPTHRNAKDAAYLRWDATGLTPVIPGISVANALAFSPDGRTLYAADAPTRLVEAFDVDPASGSISRRRPFIRLKDGEGFPDGATVDTQGGFWLAAVAAGALRRYQPDGRLDRVVPLPFSNPTKPAFGGPQLDILFITSTKMKLGTESPLNGGLFALRPGERGVAEPVLAR